MPETPCGTDKTVMVLTASEISGAILTHQLELFGFQTCLASDAKTAMHAVDDVDLVLAERDLKGQDGFEIIEELRSANTDVPIIMLTAAADHAATDPAGHLVDVFVQKPMSRAEFVAALNTWFGPQKGEDLPTVRSDTGETRKMRILAAEDNKTNRLVFQKMLKTLNVDLEFAVNGREAVDLFGTFKPDLVFMDISMPEMDGKEATRRIRDMQGKDGHTPIVALTAHAMAGDDEEILKAGIDHYMTKPLRKAAIHAQIENHWPQETQALQRPEPPQLATA
jgi:CheY-like chemotaxis protein